MAELTKPQLLVLNCIVYDLSYVKYFQLHPNNSVFQWAINYDWSKFDDSKLPGEMKRGEFAKVIDSIREHPEVFNKIQVRNIDTSSISRSKDETVVKTALIYEDNLLVLYKGTGGSMEWRDNGNGASAGMTDTKQQLDAVEYFDKMKERFGVDGQGHPRKVVVTGHSKGGNKAMYVGVLRGDLISHVYSFDGQGMGIGFLNKYALEIDRNKGKISNYVNEADFVNILLYPIAGETIYIDSSLSAQDAKDLWNIPKIVSELKHLFLSRHSPYAMFREGENGLELGNRGKQNAILADVQDLLTYLNHYMEEEDLEYFVGTLIDKLITDPHYKFEGPMPKDFKRHLISLLKGYFRSKGWNESIFDICDLTSIFGSESISDIMSVPTAPYTDALRDFSEAAKEKLLALVKEVEEEEFYQVDRWDLWYRVQDLLGGLDYPHDQEKVGEYHRKLIDMQEMSAREIERIFDEVHSIDEAYARKIKGWNAEVQEIRFRYQKLVNSFQL